MIVVRQDRFERYLKFTKTIYWALLILGMKKLLYARNFVSIHPAVQQRLY